SDLLPGCKASRARPTGNGGSCRGAAAAKEFQLLPAAAPRQEPPLPVGLARLALQPGNLLAELRQCRVSPKGAPAWQQSSPRLLSAARPHRRPLTSEAR